MPRILLNSWNGARPCFGTKEYKVDLPLREHLKPHKRFSSNDLESHKCINSTLNQFFDENLFFLNIISKTIKFCMVSLKVSIYLIINYLRNYNKNSKIKDFYKKINY